MLLRTAFSLIGILFATNVAAQSELPSTGEMLFQVFGALIFIIFLILGAAWLTKRFNLVNSVRGGDLHVIANLSLGKKEKLVLVNACGEKLLLGVTGNGVNLIKDLSSPKKQRADGHTGFSMSETPDNAYAHSDKNTHSREENSALLLSENQLDDTARSEKPDFSSFLKNILTANNRENKV